MELVEASEHDHGSAVGEVIRIQQGDKEACSNDGGSPDDSLNMGFK